MPEGDRFERGFFAGWRTAFRLAKGGMASPEEMSDKLAESITKTFRKDDGIPGLEEMSSLIVESRSDYLIKDFAALDQLVQDRLGHRHVKVAVEVAKSLIVQLGEDVKSRPEEVSTILAEATCWALIGHYFFARASQPLISDGRFTGLESYREWRDQVERVMQPVIKKIAARLVRDPSATGLRAPNRLAAKKTTHSLLNENLLPS